MTIEDLLKDDASCDDVWLLSLLVLILLDNFKKPEPTIAVYINGDKVGD